MLFVAAKFISERAQIIQQSLHTILTDAQTVGKILQGMADKGRLKGSVEDRLARIVPVSDWTDDFNDVDLVVLDMMLPKRSGFLVMEKLKRGKSPDDAPLVVMITGNLGTRHKTYAEAQGVKAYLNKPFRMEKLIEQVKNLLA